MITTCDKLADVARSIPNKISSGITDLDLHLWGGFQFLDHVAVIGEPRTINFLAINVIVTASKKNIKSYYYTSKGKRLNTVKKMIQKIGVTSCIVEDINNFYGGISESFVLVNRVKEILEEAQKEGHEGLLIIRDSILKYIREEALFPKKILEWEEKLGRMNLRSLLTVSMFESDKLDEETREFIMETFSIVIETRDSPPGVRVLKREQGRPSEWVQVDLSVP